MIGTDNDLCKCDPPGSGEAGCNSGCELREARSIHEARHRALGTQCYAFNCPDGHWLQLIRRLLDGAGVRS